MNQPAARGTRAMPSGAGEPDGAGGVVPPVLPDAHDEEVGARHDRDDPRQADGVQQRAGPAGARAEDVDPEGRAGEGVEPRAAEPDHHQRRGARGRRPTRAAQPDAGDGGGERAEPLAGDDPRPAPAEGAGDRRREVGEEEHGQGVGRARAVVGELEPGEGGEEGGRRPRRSDGVLVLRRTVVGDDPRRGGERAQPAHDVAGEQAHDRERDPEHEHADGCDVGGVHVRARDRHADHREQEHEADDVADADASGGGAPPGPTSTSRRVAGHVARSTTAVPSMMATPM